MKFWLTVLMMLGGLPSAQSYDNIRFLEPVKADEMSRPVAAAAGSSRLYVLDEKKSALFLYDSSGKLIKAVGRPGSEKTAFSSPKGVAVGPGGKVFVADTGNSRIQILDSDGNFLGSFGTRGSEAGRLKNPESIAAGEDGRLYVADTGNDRVQVFTAEGILLFQFGSSGKERGQFRRPSKVMVDPSDSIYVLDRGNERIQKFGPDAQFAKEFNLLGNDFVVDPYGFLYLLDPKNGKVIEESPDGFILGKFGSLGSGPGQLKKPEGIALAPEGTLIVLDTGNNRIWRVEISSKLKTAVLPANLETKISVSGPSRSWLVPAEVLSPLGADLYAYIPKEGRFSVLGEDGKEKARFGTREGKGPSATKGTLGFAASPKAGLYVSDTPNNRLQRFELDGTWKANLAEGSGVFDSKKREGRVSNPQGIAINDEGTVYVADPGNRRIDAFSPEGVFLFGIGPKVGPHELVFPVAVAWDKARFLYFVDKGLKKVFKCEPSGAFMAAWGSEGTGPGQFQEPSALAFDGNNYLYVLDGGLKRVSVYSKEGRWMTDLFSGGKEDRELSDPVALAVQGPRLLIADRGKGKIVSFDLHPALAAPAAVSSSTKEGLVSLSWKPVEDPWTARYRIYRSTEPAGPYVEAGISEAPKFEDSSVAAYQKYYYRVATEARTKDLGPLGAPVEVRVEGAFNRPPVEITSIEIGNIFSANYKWYLKNPAGKAVVTNNVNIPFQNVKLTFRLKDFMDFGYDTEIKKLDPQETVELPLIATLNNKILDVSEDTPIQAEFTLTYFESGKSQSLSLTKPLRVYSRNAITWDVPERIANFTTPKDPPILEFAREVLRQAPKSPKAEALNQNLVTAMHLWDALSEHGLKFFTNPSNPYETVSEDSNFPVDYTQFPRETLRRKSGQCDDLTTLIVAMLESAKVRAAIIDYPGHMAPMFDTEAADLEELGLPEEHAILYDGTYWVPLEATMIGSPFPEALRKGAYDYKTESQKGKARVIDVRKAWGSFEPATLPAGDWVPEVPKPELREKRFSTETAALFAQRHQFLKKRLEGLLQENPGDVDAHLQMGLLEYQAGSQEAAVQEFNKVLATDPANAAALNNLGNVAFLAGDHASAQEKYLKAAQSDPQDPDIWLNLVKTQLHLKDGEKAQEYGKKVVALEPNLAPAVDTLLKGM